MSRRPDDVILTASFDLTVGEACRRIGVDRVIGSVIDQGTMSVEYLNFNVNKPKRLRELYGEDVVVDEFIHDARDQVQALVFDEASDHGDQGDAALDAQAQFGPQGVFISRLPARALATEYWRLMYGSVSGL